MSNTRPNLVLALYPLLSCHKRQKVVVCFMTAISCSGTIGAGAQASLEVFLSFIFWLSFLSSEHQEKRFACEFCIDQRVYKDLEGRRGENKKQRQRVTSSWIDKRRDIRARTASVSKAETQTDSTGAGGFGPTTLYFHN